MDIHKILSDFRSSLLTALATQFQYLIIFGLIAGIAVTLILNRPDYAVRGLIYIIPGIPVAILLWVMHRKDWKYPDALILVQVNRKIFSLAFVGVFALSIGALYFSPYRPWYYFLLMTALFMLIFLQLFTDNVKPSLILLEISCAMGNLIFGLQLNYPFYFGYTDIIPHLYLSKITFLSGHIIPADLDYSYAWFPLYHIFIAEGMNLFGTDEKTAFILLTSLAFIVLTGAVYLLFKQITKNNQTSLLICLFFSITPVVITYSTYVVTRTMAFIGFVFLLLVAHTQIHTSKWRSYTILTILFSLYIILVHQVSIIQIMFLLMIFIGLEILVNDYFVFKTKIIAFIIITATTYWLYTSFLLTSVILQTADSATIPKLSGAMSQIVPGNEIIFLEDNLPLAIIIFFVILGIGYLCWAYKSKYPAVIGLFVLVVTPIYFPSPITASAMAMMTLRVDRFSLLVSPFIACALATGFLIVLFSQTKNRYTKKIAIVLGALIFSVLCFSALTGENATDSLDLSPHVNRVYFTDAELNSFDFVSQFVASNSSISTDLSSTRIFEKKFFSETQALDLPSYFATAALQSDDSGFGFRNGYFILREEELKRSGLRFESTSLTYADTVNPTEDILSKFSAMSSAADKLYDNRDVSILANRES